MAKPSKAQIIVLQHMTKGHKLCVSRGGHGCSVWLAGVLTSRGAQRSVHTNTYFAIAQRGWIEQDEHATTPWYRKDYVITQAGRDVLAESEGDVCRNS